MKTFLCPTPSIPGWLTSELGTPSRMTPYRHAIFPACPSASAAADPSQDIHSQATRCAFPLRKRIPREDCNRWGLECKTKQLDNQIYFPQGQNWTWIIRNRKRIYCFESPTSASCFSFLFYSYHWKKKEIHAGSLEISKCTQFRSKWFVVLHSLTFPGMFLFSLETNLEGSKMNFQGWRWGWNWQMLGEEGKWVWSNILCTGMKLSKN